MKDNAMQVTLQQILEAIGAPAPEGLRPDFLFTGINSLSEATAGDISFLSSERYTRELTETRASAVIATRKIKLPPNVSVPVIRVDDAELAMAKVLALFAPPVQHPPAGVDPSARVSADAVISPDASVGACAVIGSRVRIGARCVIHPGVVVGNDVSIGDDCELHPNVVIRERVTIGNRVIINAGSVIGTDGFGYRWDGKQHVKVPQIGTVVIEDDVELGSCVCVDRAKFGATVVGRGSKIDNLVQIAHNVKIGPHCIMAGQVGIAGSTTLGTGVVIGGASSIRDHVRLGDGAMVAARSAVHDDVPAKAVVSGMPALPHRQSLREQAAFRRLPEAMAQMRKLQEQIQQYLEQSGLSEDDVIGQ